MGFLIVYLNQNTDCQVKYPYDHETILQDPDPRKMQINLTGFLNGKNARIFMGELWKLLDSAQNNDSGIPQEMIDKKKEEIKNRRVRTFHICQVLKFRLIFLSIASWVLIIFYLFAQEAEDRVSRVNESLKRFSDAEDAERRQRSDRGGFGRGRSRSRSRSRSRERGRRGRSRSRDR